MSRINFGLSCAEHEKRFITSGPGLSILRLHTINGISFTQGPFTGFKSQMWEVCLCLKMTSSYEPSHEKTSFLPMQKQRCRSAVQ